MSTRIDDLPGPQISENVRDLDIRQSQEQRYELQQHPEPLSNASGGINMNIKKKVHFKDEDEYLEEEDETSPSFLSIMKSEINEENLLLLVLLVMICRPELDGYMRMVPVIGSYFANSSLLLIIAKSILILMLFILTKHYILPKIRV
jgi:hypothetical protein